MIAPCDPCFSGNASRVQCRELLGVGMEVEGGDGGGGWLKRDRQHPMDPNVRCSYLSGHFS